MPAFPPTCSASYANGVDGSLHLHACVTLVCFSVAVLIWYRLHSSGEGQPYPETTRRVLFLIVAALSAVELYHVLAGYLSIWMVWVILVSSVWGFLDAVLRYPLVYDPGSFFVMKQCLLLCLKVVCMACGLQVVDCEGILRLLVLFVVNTSLPLLYTLALPISANPVDQRLAAYDVVDVDIALRVLELTNSRQWKQERCSSLKKCVRRMALTIVNYSRPVARSPPSPFVMHSRRRRCV